MQRVVATAGIGLVHIACFPSEVARPLGRALAEQFYSEANKPASGEDFETQLGGGPPDLTDIAELLTGTVLLVWASLGLLFTLSYFQAMLSHAGRVNRPPPSQSLPTPKSTPSSSRATRRARGATRRVPDQHKTSDRPPVRLCSWCDSFKPEFCRHCPWCDRCVSFRDHHCFWINNCVGAGNHQAFLRTILLVVIGCVLMLSSTLGVWIMAPPPFPASFAASLYSPWPVLLLYTILLICQLGTTSWMLLGHVRSPVLAAFKALPSTRTN